MTKVLPMVALATMSLLVLQGCATMAPAPIRSVDETTLNALIHSPTKLTKIVVFPFTGHKAFRKASGDYFAFLLQQHHHIQTVGPAAVQEALMKNKSFDDKPAYGSGPESLDTDHATEADLIVFGKVSESFEEGLTVAVTVIDMETGGVILHTATPGVRHINLSKSDRSMEAWRQAVMLSTQSAAYDVLSILHRLDGNAWSRPADNGEENRLFSVSKQE